MRSRTRSVLHVLLAGTVAIALSAGVGACGGKSSGSSVQPVCDGSTGAGGVTVIVSPTPCDAVVSVPSGCPLALMCQITVQNNNVDDVTVRTTNGSGSVPNDEWDVMSGGNVVRDVFYACGADIDESGLMQVDVSLVDGPGAFCGRDVNWSVTLTPDP